MIPSQTLFVKSGGLIEEVISKERDTESCLTDISQSKPTNLVEINDGNEEGNALTEYLPKKNKIK